MNNKTISARSRIALAVVCATCSSFQVMAQEANTDSEQDQKLKLERIEVTSQRRVESVQDVPISVAALGAEQLDSYSIEKVEDLQFFVPNLSMSETGLSTQTFIRGIGTGNNQGFEQSVVQFVDGVSYARQQLTRAPFFDMERAEVLRGPQSILFGKNAIGGALNFTTASVEEDTTGKVSLNLGERGIQEFQGVINGALVESKLYGRLSFRRYEEDGYVYNALLERDEPAREDTTLRLKLKYLLSDSTTIDFKYENNQFETVGRQIEILQDQGNPAAPFDATLAGGFGVTTGIVETDLNYVRRANGDFSNNESDVFALTIKSEFDNFDLEATSAWLEYEFDENCDCDFIGANIFTLPMEEQYEQFSQEFRFASNHSGDIQWQTGFYYQDSSLVFGDFLTFPIGALGDANSSVIPTAVFAITGSAEQGAALSGVAADRDFTQDAESMSVFGEIVWSVNDQLKVNIGARWSSEEKEGFRQLDLIDITTGQITTNPFTPLVTAGLFAIESQQTTGHSLTSDRDETAFDPSIKVQYYVNDDFMLYATASKGSKSGGYDARANTVTSFEFEDEQATAIEFGFKNEFWDKRARLNAAIFFTDYEDLQVSQFDGTLGFVIDNADAEIRGIEIDGTVLVTEDITLNYAVAYLDHEFTDYSNGNCYYLQQADTANPDRAARFDANTGLCDYTGLSGQYTPEITSNLNLRYVRDLSSDLVLKMNVNYNYTDEQNVHQNLDPEWEIDSIGRVDVNIAIEAENWGIELLGANITDEEIVTYAGNSPLSGTFGADTVYGFIGAPATWSLRGYYHF